MRLRAVDLHLLKLPLTVPYHLAFGEVTNFVPELDRDKIATFSVATERSDTKTVAVGPAAQ